MLFVNREMKISAHFTFKGQTLGDLFCEDFEFKSNISWKATVDNIDRNESTVYLSYSFKTQVLSSNVKIKKTQPIF